MNLGGDEDGFGCAVMRGVVSGVGRRLLSHGIIVDVGFLGRR